MLVIFLIAILAVGALLYLHPKTPMIWYVENHSSELTQYAENMIENGMNGESDTYGRYHVTYWADGGMVEFISEASGLGSNTIYRGFYFSMNDAPLGFQGTNVSYIPNNRGWIWSESNGDNWEYTEKIQDHWYWFEMHF